MPCSAVTLSLATISAIIAVALLAIAFTTDNWLSYEVKRNNIQVNKYIENLVFFMLNSVLLSYLFFFFLFSINKYFIHDHPSPHTDTRACTYS